MALTTTDPFDLDIRVYASDDVDDGPTKPAISRDAYAGCIATGDDTPEGARSPAADCVGDPRWQDRDEAPAHPATAQQGACSRDPPERKA